LSQRTIAEKISCTGTGLHSGKPVQLTLHPARAHSGIVFVRSDLPHPVEIPARFDAVSSTRLATTLGRGDATLGTVEHLLSALVGLGIDNIRVEVDGPEVPVMDGSAASFVYLIRAAGIFDQRAERRVMRIRKRLEVRDGDRSIRVEPAAGLRVSYGVDYAHPAIGRQHKKQLEIDDRVYEREIARARTFGFLRDVEALWRSGLARGGNLENTVVLDDSRVLNREGLRWSDEFVRHKVLDLLGDLALLGMPLQGHVVVERGGHALHLELVRRLMTARDAWVVEGLLDPIDDDVELVPLEVPLRATA
jgi:UDP-3-O-[3-hydroxymyristoyl] N-acetylglucosamine deacetylase